MNEMQIFKSEEFGEIRTVTIDEEPWLVGKDVAEKLGYINSRDALATHVDVEDKNTVAIYDGTPGNPNQVVINESGLYALVFGSKLESARRFKHWVTHDVLPSIRQTGGYRIPQTPLEQIQIIAQGHIELVERVDAINRDFQEFKQDMPILGVDCERITRAKNQKVVSLMGGKNSPAYNDKSLRGKVYSDLNGQLRREFGVETYKAIKRNQLDLAVNFIDGYTLPMALRQLINDTNAQMTMEF